MKLSSILILFAATILTLLLIFGGLGAIVFGVGGALAFGSYALMPIALAGLISFAGGIAFAVKVAWPAWRMTIGKE